MPPLLGLIFHRKVTYLQMDVPLYRAHLTIPESCVMCIQRLYPSRQAWKIMRTLDFGS